MSRLAGPKKITEAQFQHDAILGGHEIVPMASIRGQFRSEPHIVAIRRTCPCPGLILVQLSINLGDDFVTEGRSVEERTFELNSPPMRLRVQEAVESAKRMPLTA